MSDSDLPPERMGHEALVAEMKAILSGERGKDEVFNDRCYDVFNAAMNLRNYHSGNGRWNVAAFLSETLIPFAERVGGLEEKHVKLLKRDIEKLEREKQAVKLEP